MGSTIGSRVRYRLVAEGPILQRGAWLRVPRRWVDFDRVKRELHVSNGAHWAAVSVGAPTEVVDAKITLYREVEDYIEVPRHYRVPLNARGRKGLRRRGVFSLVTTNSYKGGRIKHKITPRDKIQVEAIEALKNPGDKILALACGKGKTIVSIAAAAERNMFPVLVVVNSEALLSQWRRELKKFLQENGKRVKVGHVQGKIYQWDGYPVAVAMLQSLARKKYPEEFYRYWKLVIFDEAHRLGSEHFSKAAPLFPCERWGLSATLKRSDGNEKVIQLHLGKVAYANLDQPLDPITYFIDTGIRVKEGRYMFRRGKTNLSKLHTDLAEYEGRNKQILYYAEKALAKGRTILVLGERLTQLHWLYEHCNHPSKAMHVGPMSQEERDVALTKQIVFATQHLAKEGLDRPAFDTLFVLFPFGGEGRLKQSWGRILRVYDGKKKPKVFVFVDQVEILLALAAKMKQHLRKSKWRFADVQKKVFY